MKVNENIENPSALLPLALRLQRGELLAAECPSRSVLKHVTSQWGVLVLIVLLEGTARFSQIRKKVNGVSEKMLAQTLQSLESDGFLNRQSFPVVPPHVEYSLTPMGEEVAAHINTLADWIESNLPRIMDARINTDFNPIKSVREII